MSRDCAFPYAARLLALMGLVALATGCRHSPFQRLFDGQPVADARPVWRTEAARAHSHSHPAYLTETTPETQRIAEPVTLAKHDSSALISADSTPLLDAALKRAEAREARLAAARDAKSAVVVRSQDESIGRSRKKGASSGTAPAANVQQAMAIAAPPSVVVPLQLDPPPSASVAKTEKPMADSTTPDQVQTETPPRDAGVALASASVVEPSTGEQLPVKPPGGDEALACTEGCAAPNASQPQSEPVAELSLEPLTDLLQPSSPATVEASGPPKEAIPPPPDLAVASISSPPLLVSTPEPPKEIETPPALSIAELHLCREIRGFGKFQAVEHQGLKAGQPIFVYCELPELQYQEAAGGFVTRLSSKLEIVGEGDAVVWSQSLGEAEDHCQSRRRDNFANSRITIPAQLAPGGYRLRLSQTDLVAGRTATAELPLTIVP